MLDMPAHLHNANLLGSVWFDKNNLLSGHLSVNPDIVPNYFGHILIAILLNFFDAVVTSKIVLCIYVILFLYSWRKMLDSFSAGTSAWSFIVLPVIFNQIVFLGFINFLFSICFGMLCIASVNNYLRKSSTKELLKLFFLLILLWFSHISVFVTMLMLIAPVLLVNFSKNDFKKYIWLCILVLPFIALTFQYFLNRPARIIQKFDSSEILQMLSSGRSLIGLGNREEVFSIPYVFIIFGLAVFGLSWQLSHKTIAVKKMISGLAVFCVAMLMIFFIPDSDGRGGLMTARLMLILYIILVVFVSLLMTGLPYLKMVVAFFGMVWALSWNINNQIELQKFQGNINMVLKAEKFIQPNSVIYVIDKSEMWLYKHVSNYLGTAKPVVVSENYEAYHDYFPLRFKTNYFQRIEGLYTSSTLSICEVFKQIDNKFPNYVFIYGEAAGVLDAELNRNADLYQYYDVVYSDLFCHLFKRKA